MATRSFDDKFGEGFMDSVPTSPGVYRYLDRDGVVLYVGKAKNLRRRLANYRNATRRKSHRKLRRVVRHAARLEFELLATEEEALLRESELIRTLRPRLNVEGAYSFLYPFVGIGTWDKRLLLCRTTQPESYQELGLEWYGCFRSRLRVNAAFDALVALLGLVGHREKVARLPPVPQLRGSRRVGFRQVPAELQTALPLFLGGVDKTLPALLARALLARPAARRDASEVQQHLLALNDFFMRDTARLRVALTTLGVTGTWVGQAERDALFVRAGFAVETEPEETAES